jgi:hypothetical protein
MLGRAGTTAVGAALALGIAVASSAVPAAAAAKPTGPVYVLSAASLTSAPGHGRNVVLRLHGTGTKVTSFGRGGRGAELNVATRELLSAWRRLGFTRRHPLATVDEAGDRRGATLVRLGRPRLDAAGTGIVVPARPAAGTGRALADRLRDAAPDVPKRAGATTISIDATVADAGAVDTIADPLGHGPGGWIAFHTYIAAYSGDGGCTDGSTWGVGGDCTGKFNDPGTEPFDGAYPDGITGSVHWRGTSDITFTSRVPTTRGTIDYGYLHGSVPTAGSPALTIDRGQFFNTPNWTIEGSGTDPALLEKPGGPLGINAQFHTPFFTNSGYSFDVTGYLWCGPDCRK